MTRTLIYNTQRQRHSLTLTLDTRSRPSMTKAPNHAHLPNRHPRPRSGIHKPRNLIYSALGKIQKHSLVLTLDTRSWPSMTAGFNGYLSNSNYRHPRPRSGIHKPRTLNYAAFRKTQRHSLTLILDTRSSRV